MQHAASILTKVLQNHPLFQSVDWASRESSKSQFRITIKKEMRQLKNGQYHAQPSLREMIEKDLPQSKEYFLESLWQAISQNDNPNIYQAIDQVSEDPKLHRIIANECTGWFNREEQAQVDLEEATPNQTPHTTLEQSKLEAPICDDKQSKPPSLSETLWQHDYRLQPDLQWVPKAELYSGLSLIKRMQFEQGAQRHPDWAPTFERQLVELQALSTAKYKSLDDVQLDPTAPYVSTEILSYYLQSYYNKIFTITIQDGEYSISWTYGNYKQLERFLNKRYYANEADEYAKFKNGFTTFLDTNPSIKQKLEVLYNQREVHFLQEEWPTYTIHNHLKGWQSAKTPHPYQNQAAHRALIQGNLINSLDVGLGKTLTTLLSVFKAKQDGWAKRIVITTPGSVIAKWYHEIKEIKPDAKVLVIGAQIRNGVWKEVSGAMELSAQLAQGIYDYDIILMTHTTLGRIPMDKERRYELLKAEFQAQSGRRMPSHLQDDYVLLQVEEMIRRGELSLQGIEHTLSQKDELLNKAYSKKDKAKVKEQIAFLTKASTLLHKAAKATPQLTQTWESLGIDMLIVDEAHNFKALWEVESRHAVKYMGNSPASQRACDLLYKVRNVQHNNNGKGVIFLTATPMVNGPTELYNMISFIEPGLFEQIGIRNVSEFVNFYCEIKHELSLDESGQLTQVPYLAGLKHVDELRQIALGVIHRKTAKDVGLRIPLSTPEYILHQADPDQEQAISFIAQNPKDALDVYMGIKIKDDELHNYRLVLAHLLKRAELDLEMLDPLRYKGYISPKVRGWIEEVKRCAEKGEKVVTFVDSTEMPSPDGINPNGYSFHQKLKNLLLQHTSLQDKEIAIVNAKSTPSAASRYQVSTDLAQGKVKVLIGNTATMGEGMDLQIDVANLLRLEIPWNRAKFDQQSGRVKRQGNDHQSINEKIFMGTRGLDVMMMDILRGKSTWYQQFWDGQEDNLSTDAEDIIPSLDMIRCLAIANEAERESALQEAKDKQQAEVAQKKYQQSLKLLDRYQKIYVSYMKSSKKGGKVTEQIRQSLHKVRSLIENTPELATLHHLLDDPSEYLVLSEQGVILQKNHVYSINYNGKEEVCIIRSATFSGYIDHLAPIVKQRGVSYAKELAPSEIIQRLWKEQPQHVYTALGVQPQLLGTLKEALLQAGEPIIVWRNGQAILQEYSGQDPVLPLNQEACLAVKKLLEEDHTLINQAQKQGFSVSYPLEVLAPHPLQNHQEQANAPTLLK